MVNKSLDYYEGVIDSVKDMRHLLHGMIINEELMYSIDKCLYERIKEAKEAEERILEHMAEQARE